MTLRRWLYRGLFILGMTKYNGPLLYQWLNAPFGRISQDFWDEAAIALPCILCVLHLLWMRLTFKAEAQEHAMTVLTPLGVLSIRGDEAGFFGWPSVSKIFARSGDVYFRTLTDQWTAVPRLAFANADAATAFVKQATKLRDGSWKSPAIEEIVESAAYESSLLKHRTTIGSTLIARDEDRLTICQRSSSSAANLGMNCLITSVIAIWASLHSHTFSGGVALGIAIILTVLTIRYAGSSAPKIVLDRAAGLMRDSLNKEPVPLSSITGILVKNRNGASTTFLQDNIKRPMNLRGTNTAPWADALYGASVMADFLHVPVVVEP